jgi:Glycosyltransferase sugar-binding region containing DXD motif
MTASPPDTVWIYWEGPVLPYIELCARTISAHHPNVRRLDAAGFEALRGTDADLDLSRLKLNHKADYIRAYLLHRYGGLWLDIDCVVLQPLAPLLEALRVAEYVGYREAKYQDPQLGLMASIAGGRIIRRHYEKVASFLRTRKDPQWLDLSSWPMDKALAEESWQGYLQLDRRRVVPVGWADNDSFFVERDDGGHVGFFDDRALCYMLYNAMIPGWFKALSADEILGGRTFLSYLFRRALGRIEGR